MVPVHPPVRPHPRRGEILGKMDRHFAETELLRGKPSGVADDALPESEFLNYGG